MTSKKVSNDEIDLAVIINSVFEKKWKVIIITGISILLAFIFTDNQNYQKNIFFNGETKIKSISTFDEFKYETYNRYIEHKTSQSKFYSINSFKDPKNLEPLSEPYILREFYSYKNIDY